MRKSLLLLFLVLCFGTGSIFAQQSDYTDEEGRLLSKRGQVILPAAGDFALGLDARPLLNIFNFTAGNPPSAEMINQQIFLKYFTSDNMAFRVRVRLDQAIDTDRNRVILDNQQIPNPDIEVTDEWTDKSTFVRIGGGMEVRKGKGRVVGVFGGEASFLYAKSSTEYDYGNPITEGNQSPTTTPGFGSVNGSRFERIVESQAGKHLGFGVNGFAGVEYFIAPQISLGAEFTLGFDFTKNFREERVYEFWDIASGSRQTRSSVFEGGNEFSLGTGNYGGSINLMFYF